MTKTTQDLKSRAILALIVVQVLFGVNFITSKIVMQSIPPLLWSSMRVVFSAIGLLILALFSGKPSPAFTKENFRPLAYFAFLSMIVSQTAFQAGLSLSTATNTAIINTLTPVFTLLFVIFSGKESLSWKRFIGFVCAFGGVLAIRGVENYSLSDQTFIGDALTLLNCLGFGLFLTVSKRYVETHDALWTTAWIFILGSVGLIILSIPSLQGFEFPVMTAELLGCMVVSIFGSTLLAYYLNMWALAYLNSSLVALFIYLQPVVASLLAWMIFGEIITIRTIASSLLVFAGIVLATRK